MRVLVPGPVREGDLVDLDEEEAHHLRVRRARDGELVELRNGAGLRGEGALAGGAGRQVRVARAAVEVAPVQSLIAVGAGDRDRFEWLAEKAAELGATDLVPIETERTRAVATRVRPSHIERLRRRALESLKQSGATWSLRIHDVMPLAAFVASAAGDAAVGRWLADPDGASPPAEIDGPQYVVVGPEGGLSEEERSALTGAGWRALRLAPYTLRFETAAVAAAAWLAAARERKA